MMRRSLILSIVLLAGAGCGGPGAAPPAPAESEALARLRTALDAWKAGKVEGLASASPPLRFVDPDQAAGAKLTSYTPGDAPKTTDHVVDYPVELTIVDAKRKSRTVQAVYQIVDDPAPAVLRNDP